jgi:hypothetical protein
MNRRLETPGYVFFFTFFCSNVLSRPTMPFFHSCHPRHLILHGFRWNRPFHDYRCRSNLWRFRTIPCIFSSYKSTLLHQISISCLELIARLLPWPRFNTSQHAFHVRDNQAREAPRNGRKGPKRQFIQRQFIQWQFIRRLGSGFTFFSLFLSTYYMTMRTPSPLAPTTTNACSRVETGLFFFNNFSVPVLPARKHVTFLQM